MLMAKNADICSKCPVTEPWVRSFMDPKLRSAFQLLKLGVPQGRASHHKPLTMHEGHCQWQACRLRTDHANARTHGQTPDRRVFLANAKDRIELLANAPPPPFS